MKDDKLQEIIELLPYSIRYSGEIEELLDYAKEQAERVQELEELIEDYKTVNKELHDRRKKLRKQNKRYREAIEVAIHNMAVSDNLGVKFALGILEQALEGDE